MKGLNDTDLAIIALLQAEGRATFAQIAQQVGLSPAAVHERVKKLEARGVITGYKAVVDPEKLGAGVTAFVLVTQTARPRGGLEDAFERWPWVEECHHIAGEESLLLKVRAESTRALEHVLWEIRALESVERTKTVIALTTEFEGRPGDADAHRGGRRPVGRCLDDLERLFDHAHVADAKAAHVGAAARERDDHVDRLRPERLLGVRAGRIGR